MNETSGLLVPQSTRVEDIERRKKERLALEKEKRRNKLKRINKKMGFGEKITIEAITRARVEESFDTLSVTPFQALRKLLRVSQREFAKLIDVNTSSVCLYETGKKIPHVPIAKRMQEEARKRGVAVTLDELYQNVMMHDRRLKWERDKEESKEEE